MGIIAQGIITLTSVNDAFSVSLSPSSCVINADYNGKNPKLTYAYSDIKVIRGETAVPFDEPKILGKTNAATAEIVKVDDTTWRIKILSIPETDLNGSFQLEIKAGIDFQTVATFAYTVVRETSMLDWILDWNGTYTEISGKWIITPKIFAGTKDADNKITGVYLGPAFDNSGSTGLYGYKDDEIIFQLTETGGMIGGWHIENGGIQTSDGVLKILAEGTIISAPDGKMAWELLKDGTASFAGGNVHFYANGDADFKGTITSTSGQIGGWTIGAHSLYNNAILIDSSTQFIGIRRVANMIFAGEPSSEGFHKNIKQSGGIAIFSQNDVAYGMECWIPASNVINPTLNPVDGYKVFSLGYQNMIASWNFDAVALWIGTKNNTARQNTSSSGSITIGTAGIRGMNWYIDNDGEISFVDGLLHFDKNGGTIAGWTLNKNMFAVTNAALVSASGYTGLYLSNSTLPESYTSYESHIIRNGGIFLTTSGAGPRLHGRNTEGKLVFQLANGVSFIGGWWFTESCLFTGASSTPKGEFASAGNITLSPDGLRGYKFRLEASGSGAIAGGKISWDDNGNITFDNSVKISWSQVTGTDNVMTKATYIDANGIFTGKVNADNITTGTLAAERINADALLSNGDKWALLKDGSGYLASRNISWNTDGTLTVKGHVEANSGVIGGFKITDSGIFSLETNYYTGDVRNGAFSMFSQGSSAFLCFHDDGRWAGIGLNCSPAGGTATIARFENYYKDGVFANWSTNIALYLRAENARHNFAFLGKGNGVLNGYIVGSKLSLFTLSQYNTIYSGYIKPAENNRWIVKATAEKAGFQLPSCSEIALALGLNTSSAWAVEFIIIGDLDSKAFTVYGKYLKVIGDSPNQSAPWCKEGDPLLINANGARIDSVNVGPGDSLRLLFVNNPNETKKDADSEITLNGTKKKITWSYKYTARILNYAT